MQVVDHKNMLTCDSANWAANSAGLSSACAERHSNRPEGVCTRQHPSPRTNHSGSSDWVQAGSDLIDAELARDNRPVVLYGLSAGGMETYHVAARNRRVKAIAGMTFLDQRDAQVRDETALNRFMSRVGGPMLNLTAKTPLAGMRLPMSLTSKMNALVNDKQALQAFMRDRSSAGNAMSIAFLSSYLSYQPAQEPEDFAVCPILLTQPAQDRWTPLHLSTPFLNRVRRVPVKVVMLENAGHYPLEQPGLSQMVEVIDRFYQEATGASAIGAAGKIPETK
ncbi:alpha/beta fold hydrolase [Chromobacterium sp. CV08]|uniref:alpha/beta fold hydrolase n=1 Tax=Chromobacterium sp. CV08 TaxID=3133274 RepID=UPI003DA9BFB8